LHVSLSEPLHWNRRFFHLDEQDEKKVRPHLDAVNMAACETWTKLQPIKNLLFSAAKKMLIKSRFQQNIGAVPGYEKCAYALS
jgi:hypothetical protein